MEKYKVAFVILHYYTIEDTKKCVNSIFDIFDEVNVIIVDNASPNNTGSELRKIYNSNRNVHVIINKENLGFARGNNIGFEYAKNKLKSDFIILCNNDTYLTDKNFWSKVLNEYEKSNFAVLGPKIILRDNSVNNIVLNLPSIKFVKKTIRRNYVRYIVYKYLIVLIPFYRLKICIEELCKRIIKKILTKLKRIKVNSNTKNERHENILLHGCFLIFSKEYIDRFDGLNSKTFLYREEDLLLLRLRQYNLKNVYNPDIFIYHNEDGATNAITESNRNKIIFLSRNYIDSSKILLEEMIKYKKECTNMKI